MIRAVCLVLFILIILIPFLHFSYPTSAEEVKSISYLQVKQNKPQIATPHTLKIPTAKIQTSVEELSIIGGVMEDPTGIEKAGWYKESVKPGQMGNAVISGHLDDADGNPAVFWKLHQVQMGDTVQVEDREGTSYQFIVREIKEYPSDRLPLATFFTKSFESNLILITCSGVYDESKNQYSKRLVVVATRQES